MWADAFVRHRLDGKSELNVQPKDNAPAIKFVRSNVCVNTVDQLRGQLTEIDLLLGCQSIKDPLAVVTQLPGQMLPVGVSALDPGFELAIELRLRDFSGFVLDVIG
jgi:hypothetical protein